MPLSFIAGGGGFAGATYEPTACDERPAPMADAGPLIAGIGQTLPAAFIFSLDCPSLLAYSIASEKTRFP